MPLLVACRGMCWPTQLCDWSADRRPPGRGRARPVGEHREVDGLAGVGGELAADRAGLLHDVEPRGGRAGEPQQADAEAVLPAVLGLLDEVVRLERGDQPERRALVDSSSAAISVTPASPEPGEDLQDRQRPVDGLDTAREPRQRCSWRNASASGVLGTAARSVAELGAGGG